MKPCPFCQNPNVEDTGGACCFCDYQGEVSIGKNKMFSNLEQYNKIFFATNHQDRMDELHSRNDINRPNNLQL